MKVIFKKNNRYVRILISKDSFSHRSLPGITIGYDEEKAQMYFVPSRSGRVVRKIDDSPQLMKEYYEIRVFLVRFPDIKDLVFDKAYPAEKNPDGMLAVKL